MVVWTRALDLGQRSSTPALSSDDLQNVACGVKRLDSSWFSGKEVTLLNIIRGSVVN